MVCQRVYLGVGRGERWEGEVGRIENRSSYMATALFCEKKERVSLLPTYPFRTDLKYRCFTNIKVRCLRPMSIQHLMGRVQDDTELHHYDCGRCLIVGLTP